MVICSERQHIVLYYVQKQLNVEQLFAAHRTIARSFVLRGTQRVPYLKSVLFFLQVCKNIKLKKYKKFKTLKNLPIPVFYPQQACRWVVFQR